MPLGHCGCEAPRCLPALASNARQCVRSAAEESRINQTFRSRSRATLDAFSREPTVVRVRVLLVDNEHVELQRVRTAVHLTPDIRIVGVASTAEQALAQAVAVKPDVVLLEVAILGVDGVHFISEIRRQCPQANILVHTHLHDSELAIRAVEAGAAGYVFKGIAAETLVSAIRQVAAKGAMLDPMVARGVVNLLAIPNADGPREEMLAQGFSKREIEVLVALARGLRDREIARSLFLSEATVKTHLKAVYRKLRVRNRAQAAAVATSRGLIALVLWLCLSRGTHRLVLASWISRSTPQTFP